MPTQSLHPFKTGTRLTVSGAALAEIRSKMAAALIGRTVNLLATPRRITHGLVTAVCHEAGTPQLVVGGVRYDLNRILTVAPSPLN